MNSLAKVPVTVVTGFLGSGKTTLIQHLLANPNGKRLAVKITYKKDPGQPSTTVTYHGMETPQVTDDTFAAKIPDGYQRIKIMRHATVNDPKVEEAPADPEPPKPSAAPRKK